MLKWAERVEMTLAFWRGLRRRDARGPAPSVWLDRQRFLVLGEAYSYAMHQAAQAELHAILARAQFEDARTKEDLERGEAAFNAAVREVVRWRDAAKAAREAVDAYVMDRGGAPLEVEAERAQGAAEASRAV